MIGLQEILEE